MPLVKVGAPIVSAVTAANGADVVVEVVTPNPVKAAVPKYEGRKASSDAMSKEEWAAKDRRIGRAGLYQAALQSVGVLQYSVGTTLEDYLKTVRKVAEDGLAFVNEAV